MSVPRKQASQESKVYLAFQVIPRLKQGNNFEDEVLSFLCPKEEVDNFLPLFNKMTISPPSPLKRFEESQRTVKYNRNTQYA